MNKYKIANEWNYDASCTLTPFPVWDSENFKNLIFVAQTYLPLFTYHESTNSGAVGFDTNTHARAA
jgi:hypothetical protein